MSIPELRARNYPEKMIHRPPSPMAGCRDPWLMIPASLALIVTLVTCERKHHRTVLCRRLAGLILRCMFMAYVAFIALDLSKDWNPTVGNRDELCAKLRNSRFLLPVLG